MSFSRISHFALGLLLICSPLSRAEAWNGALSGELTSAQVAGAAPPTNGVPLSGSGRLSAEDGLSVIGTFKLPSVEGLSLISIRVDASGLGQTRSLPGEGRLITYQERDASGALTFSASAYEGWVEVVERSEGLARLRFEINARQGAQVRSLRSDGPQALTLTQLERSLDEGDDGLASGGDLLIGVAEEGADEGCDSGSFDDEDVYETEGEVGCDEGADDWSDEGELSEESSSSSCEEDEWAAEASALSARPAASHRRARSKLLGLLGRLAPLWCSLLVLRLWRRRALVELRLKQRRPSA